MVLLVYLFSITEFMVKSSGSIKSVNIFERNFFMEHLITTEMEVIDLLEYAKAGKNPPKGKKYKFKVKNKVYEVSVEAMTGREICEMAGLIPPEMFRLDMKLKGNVWKKIELDEIVDFTTPGIEKFEYVSLDQTEG